MSIHVLHVPSELISERPDGETRWCFYCRERRAFLRQVYRPTDPMSYYGPHASIKCEHGHRNGDIFPGGWGEWK